MRLWTLSRKVGSGLLRARVNFPWIRKDVCTHHALSSLAAMLPAPSQMFLLRLYSQLTDAHALDFGLHIISKHSTSTRCPNFSFPRTAFVTTCERAHTYARACTPSVQLGRCCPQGRFDVCRHFGCHGLWGEVLTAEQGHSLPGAILGSVGCSAASLTPTHLMPLVVMTTTNDPRHGPVSVGKSHPFLQQKAVLL